MWNKQTLTTAANTKTVHFLGRGSVFVEGTFGGGTVKVQLLYRDPTSGVHSTSSTYLGDALNGNTVNSIDLPAGEYVLTLVDSTSGSVDVYYSNQVDTIR